MIGHAGIDHGDAKAVAVEKRIVIGAERWRVGRHARRRGGPRHLGVVADEPDAVALGQFVHLSSPDVHGEHRKVVELQPCRSSGVVERVVYLVDGGGVDLQDQIDVVRTALLDHVGDPVADPVARPPVLARIDERRRAGQSQGEQRDENRLTSHGAQTSADRERQP